MRLRIAYIISHGHTARGALQTGLLSKMAEHYEVVVITKVSSTPILEPLRSLGIELVSFNYSIDRKEEQRGILRSHVHQNIKRNPALWEKHLRRTRNKSFRWKRRLLNHLHYWVGTVIRTVPGGQSRFTRWEQEGYYKPHVAELLDSLQLNAIISTRPVDEMEMYLLEAARRLNIHRIFYILSWDNITSKGIFPVLANSYLTWGPIMNEELQEYYGVSEGNMYSTGVTHFDVHAQVNDGILDIPNLLSSIGLEDNKPYLFFTMSASYFAPNEIDIVEHLARQVELNTFGVEMQLVVRPHMANLMADRSDQSWLSRLKTLKSNRVVVDFPDASNSLLTWYVDKGDMIRLSRLLHGATVCLNSGSTVAIEAIYLNRPVIITAFDTEHWPLWSSARRLRDYLHLQKLFALRACKLVDDLQQMDEAIANYISNPEMDAEARKRAIERECYRNDGRATERFMAHVNTIMEKL